MTALLILFLMAILLVGVLVLVIMIIDPFLGEESPLFKHEKIKVYNKLYKCDICHLMFRRYQMDLYHAKHGKEGHCPHCEGYIGAYISLSYPSSDKVYTTKISSPAKWMDVHLDCPKLDFIGAIKMLNTIKSLENTRKDEENIREFEEYNRIESNLKWIENLKEKE